MQNIDKYNFNGKKTFVRVDFNVPIDKDGNITDQTRILGALPTLQKIVADGGKLIIASHMGRPEKNPDERYSLKKIVPCVSNLLGLEVKFAPDCAKAQQLVSELKNGEVLMLENLRFYPEEEGKPRGLPNNCTDEEKTEAKKAIKQSQKKFVETLAGYADCYVNDAFGTAHRAHASTALIADYFADNKMFGYLMQKEVEAVKAVMSNPKRPFTAIMGGAKVSSKIDIIENLLTKVDNLIIAGGMTFTFVKALGGEIGSSLCENDKLDMAIAILEKAKKNGVRLVLQTDAKIADKFDNNAQSRFVEVGKIPQGWMGLDIGPETEKLFSDIIALSKTIIWNGPAGVFEFENFSHGSYAVAKAIADSTKNGAYSLIGGGDSVACINKFGFANDVSYVSTGGGALLEAIEGKILPGIAAIEK